MTKYQHARLKLILIIVFSGIIIIGVPVGIGILCMPVVGKVFGYLIAAGLSIIFAAVMFNNTGARNTYERYKNQNLHSQTDDLKVSGQ